MTLTALEVSVELTLGRSPVAPDVRFWVDCGFSGDLRSETELSLTLERPWRWSGTLLVEQASAFFYRIGISAQAGVDWTLRIHDPARGCDVLFDQDSSTTSKSWLLGTCQLAPSGASSLPTERKAMPSRRFGSGVSATLETRQPTAGGKVIVLAQRRQR